MRSHGALAVALLLVAPGRGGAGELTGSVRYGGPASAPGTIPTTKDRAVCGGTIEEESLVVAGDRVANAVVVVKGAPAAPPVRATLDQERCRYRPHVQAVPVGSTLDITNGDPLLHSVHGWSGHVTRFDIVTPSRGMRVPTRLDKPGLIQVRCDVHAWMVAYVLVVEGPATVTGRDGAFAIHDLPAGKYVVTTWHERLGEKRAEVTVPARGEVRLDVSYGP